MGIPVGKLSAPVEQHREIDPWRFGLLRRELCKKGQDTLYLKKFNVQGSNLYKHQYMTNVQAAAAEGLTLSKITALANTTLEFSIPVYKNMPAGACRQTDAGRQPEQQAVGAGCRWICTDTDL